MCRKAWTEALPEGGALPRGFPSSTVPGNEMQAEAVHHREEPRGWPWEQAKKAVLTEGLPRGPVAAWWRAWVWMCPGEVLGTQAADLLTSHL